MIDLGVKTIFPEIDSSNSSNIKQRHDFGKDLFTKKLSNSITINFNTSQKNYKILKIPKLFQNIKTFPKNKTNELLSLKKEENLRKIWEPKNKQNSFHKQGLIENENTNEKLNIQLDSPLKNIKSKKEIQEWFNNKEKTGKIKKIIFDSISQRKNYNSFKDNTLNEEKSKNIFDHEKIMSNKKFIFKNLKIRNKSDNNFGNIIERISKEEKKSKLFIKSFFENLLDINISYEFYNKIIPLINKLNQIFYFLFDIKSFPINPLNIKFLEIHKISTILVVSLIIITKDNNLYKEKILKMKELFQKYIYISINSINFKVLESPKINIFMSNLNKPKENTSLIDILNEIINLLFDNKKDDYKKLLDCLRQLANNINNQTPYEVLSIINDCILFCHNCSYESNKFNKNEIKRRCIFSKFSDEDNNIKPPFIKNKMSKKYCLVLDLDETLIHGMYFPFGYYFFVRPGVFDFLEKMHNLFEIIIFTAAKKEYVYDIIEKIDYKDYIDYILYKKHIINEKGSLAKKLDLIGRDLNKIIYVDNLENNAKYNKKNLYLISSWYNNIFDKEIYILKDKLIYIATCEKFENDITQGLL